MQINAIIEPCSVESIAFTEPRLEFIYFIGTDDLIQPLPSLEQSPSCGKSFTATYSIWDIITELPPEMLWNSLVIDEVKGVIKVNAKDESIAGKSVKLLINVKHDLGL